MAHRRKEIRDRFITLLTGLTTTGSNVFRTRIFPLTSDELPGLCVFSEAEEIEQGAQGGALDRLLTVLVEAYVKDSSGDVDDTLDAIAEDVEAAIAADPTLSGLALSVFPASVEFEFDRQTEKPVGIMSIRYQVFYRS